MIEQPEFQNVERVQDILNLLEEEIFWKVCFCLQWINRLLFISDLKIYLNRFQICRLSEHQFTSQGRVIGSVAVLGPTRMQYSKIIGMMYFMQQRLNTLLKEEE
ncbi:MAG: hypothetical protein ACLR1D_05500 [Dialister sp.]